jgi:hypothetical protein
MKELTIQIKTFGTLSTNYFLIRIHLHQLLILKDIEVFYQRNEGKDKIGTTFYLE